MPSESGGAFLLLRRLADLPRASDELAAYLSIRRRCLPGGATDTLIGIWIDEDDATNLPSALALPDAGGEWRSLRILETTGINGIWMLCWLEPAAGNVARVDLMAALLECFGHDGADGAVRSPRFMPVFAGNADDEHSLAELHDLESRYGALLLSPGYLDVHGGLLLSTVLAHRPRETA